MKLNENGKYMREKRNAFIHIHRHRQPIQQDSLCGLHFRVIYCACTTEQNQTKRINLRSPKISCVDYYSKPNTLSIHTTTKFSVSEVSYCLFAWLVGCLFCCCFYFFILPFTRKQLAIKYLCQCLSTQSVRRIY